MDRATCIEPFTRMELVVKHAIVSILSKPQWSVKWQDDTIRRKWLGEIRRAYLEQTYTHGRWWRPAAVARKNIAELAKKRLSDIKRAKHLTGDDRYECFIGLHAYLIVQTFFDQYRDPAAPAKRHLDPSVVPRLVNFTWSALEGAGDVAANVADALEAEAIQATPQTITMLTDVCLRIRAELESVEAFIVREVDAALPQAAEQLASPPDAFHTDDVATMTSVGVHGAWLSDGLIPTALKTKFVREVGVLEKVPAKAKDWHPNTNKKVLDLIHPSLFCWVRGRTRKLSAALDPESFADPAEQMEQLVQLAPSLSADTVVPFFGFGSGGHFQWLPTDMLVRADGSVRVLSYINNLHPRRHAALYDSIAAIVARFVPLFDRALVAYNEPFPARAFISDDDQIANVSERPRPPTGATDSNSAAAPTSHSAAGVTLKGQTVQVIVKVAEIVLTPASPKYEGGTWHIEGTHSESIAATGIYYFGSDNIKDSRLSFRVNVTDEYLEERVRMRDEVQGVGLAYGFFEGSVLVQQLGSVSAIEDRCLVFPNGVQHKVEPFELADATKRGVRKILALFLVDPKVTVASTGVVPPQQHDWVNELLTPAAPKTKKPRVSAAAAAQPDGVQTYTMTLDEAKAFRLELMKERSLADKKRGQDNKMAPFNLCEH